MVRHKMIPMPDANVGEVLGLVEIVYAYGQKAKISFLAEEFRMQLDDLGDVVDMAELLHLLKVNDGEVSLTVFGEAANLGTIDDKKRILRKHLICIEPFKSTLAILKKEGGIKSRDLFAYLRTKGMVIQDEARFHKLLLAWGGYTEIFSYDGTKQCFKPLKNALSDQ